MGVNSIPPKTCSYSCVYCQLGRTHRMQTERKEFLEPEAVFQQVRTKIKQARGIGAPIDYVTFVPDGEPTLDVNLGQEIAMLRSLGFPVAVITNASLIWRDDVRRDLGQADWVSLKVDATREAVWRQIDRPHGGLALSSIIEGMIEFAETYTGELVTETMLVQGVNDREEDVRGVASLLNRLKPARAYLSIPTRPPAEAWVRALDEGRILHAYQIVSEKVERVECLVGYEGNEFASVGTLAEDLLSITAVHPMRKDAVDTLLAKAGAPWAIVDNLVACGQIIQVEYEGHQFYVRRLPGIGNHMKR